MDIRDVPADAVVEVRDLDVEGALPDELQDTEDGEAYVTKW